MYSTQLQKAIDLDYQIKRLKQLLAIYTDGRPIILDWYVWGQLYTEEKYIPPSDEARQDLIVLLKNLVARYEKEFAAL